MSYTAIYSFTNFIILLLLLQSFFTIITCGFQSESYRITVSAEAKFKPNPPARVEMRKINSFEFGALYLRISNLRCTRLVVLVVKATELLLNF